MRFKPKDIVYRLNNGSNVGGQEGDDYGAFAGERGEIMEIFDNGHLKILTSRRSGAVWFTRNVMEELLYNSPLMQALR